jgi:hypothetical protein
MSNGKRLMNFRLTEEEAAILADYCERTARTQTDVLRELVRELAQRPTLSRRRAASLRPPAKAQSRAASIAHQTRRTT